MACTRMGDAIMNPIMDISDDAPRSMARDGDISTNGRNA